MADVPRGLPFWETIPLHDMTDEQWESLCDGCGRCCLQKLEDEDTGDIYFTSISCRLLDLESCRCSNYSDRKKLVADCTLVRPLTPEKKNWLPETCAYRRVSEGKGLANWHPLISGHRESVHEANISVRDIAQPEDTVKLEFYQDYLINFGSAEQSDDEQ